jgi:hypothetical protein
MLLVLIVSVPSGFTISLTSSVQSMTPQTADRISSFWAAFFSVRLRSSAKSSVGAVGNPLTKDPGIVLAVAPSTACVSSIATGSRLAQISGEICEG